MIFLPADREICKTILRSVRKDGFTNGTVADGIVKLGFHLIGAPYEEDTLEQKGPEELVVNLRAFDCVTLIENVIVLARLGRTGRSSFRDFTDELERIRYRGGRRNGYASRLHYFTDWLLDNGRRGIVRDVTRELGGRPFRKDFHAMTDRREQIPPLRDADVFRRMRFVEAACSSRTFYYIPKTHVIEMQKQIENGDIIAITTDVEGIDVRHVGMAVRGPRGLHLLHASRKAGKVVLSGATLSRYLLSHRARTGIIVGRVSPADVAPARPAREKR